MKQRDLYILLISTFVIILFWISFTIYHNLVSSTIPETLNVQINPINPNFDTKTIDLIKKRDNTDTIYESTVKPTETIPTPTVASQGGTIAE
jgi:hypothetical protein